MFDMRMVLRIVPSAAMEQGWTWTWI